MARIARVVAPGIPHHVIQRGNRRQQTFFNEDDYQAYLQLMSEWCSRYRVEAWGYWLMPNHVHLIFIPETKDGLNLAVGEAHRRYARMINFREGWRGHLWQGVSLHLLWMKGIFTKPWDMFLMSDVGQDEINLFRRHERTGRPMVDETFIDMLENLLDRTLKRQKPGLKSEKDK
jgi:putative transposase